MTNENQTDGQTSTESIGVTEMQNEEIINIVYNASKSIDNFICGLRTGVYENSTQAKRLLITAVELLKTAEKIRNEEVN